MPLTRRHLLTALGAVTASMGLAACTRPPEVPAVSDPAATGPVRLTYGDDPGQVAELTVPGGTPVGVAVLLHGGFWKAQYGLEYAQPLAPSLVDRGWATLVPEYRRVGNGGGVPQTLDDVAAALELLTDDAAIEAAVGAPLPLDTVVGIGHSAGGHLVTWAAGPGGPGVLTHVISQAGVLDLAGATRENLGGGAVTDFLGHAFGDEQADEAVDPLSQVPLDVPVWCVHAGGDTTVPLTQSQAYVDAATGAGATAALVEVDGDHFTVIDPDSDAWARTLEIVDGLAG